jgi:hypothetical protein
VTPQGRLRLPPRRSPWIIGATEILRPPNPGLNMTGGLGIESLIRSRAHRWTPVEAQMAPRQARGLGLQSLVSLPRVAIERLRPMSLGRIR